MHKNLSGLFSNKFNRFIKIIFLLSDLLPRITRLCDNRILGDRDLLLKACSGDATECTFAGCQYKKSSSTTTGAAKYKRKIHKIKHNFRCYCTCGVSYADFEQFTRLKANHSGADHELYLVAINKVNEFRQLLLDRGVHAAKDMRKPKTMHQLMAAEKRKNDSKSKRSSSAMSQVTSTTTSTATASTSNGAASGSINSTSLIPKNNCIVLLKRITPSRDETSRVSSSSNPSNSGAQSPPSALTTTTSNSSNSSSALIPSTSVPMNASRFSVPPASPTTSITSVSTPTISRCNNTSNRESPHSTSTPITSPHPMSMSAPGFQMPDTPGSLKRKIRVSPSQGKARRLDFSSETIHNSTISDPSLSPISSRSGTDVSSASSFDNHDHIIQYINNLQNLHSPPRLISTHTQTSFESMLPSLPEASTESFRKCFRDLHNAGIMNSTIFQHLSTALDLVDLKNNPVHDLSL
jgi:hypothetical protein